MIIFGKFFILSLAATTAIAAPETKKRQIGDVISSLVDGGESVFDEATQAAGSVFSEATENLGDIATKVTSIAGSAYTVVTEAGGDAITLAESGVGVVTSWGGSIYTIATSAVQSAASDAADAADDDDGAFTASMNPMAVLIAFATVAGGVLIGALAV